MNGEAAFRRQPSQAEASLVFASAGGRTRLLSQHVPYPFHITRPFHLGDGPPGMATLYLQSSSGGIYRDDRLALDLALRSGAAAHVTTQASTIVHDTQDGTASQTIRLEVGEDAFLALVQDPLVLFPRSRMRTHLDLTLARSANVILADGAGAHDPAGKNEAFGDLDWRTGVRTPDGQLLVLDRWRIEGEAFQAQAGPLRGQGGVGTVLVLTRQPIDPENLRAAARDCGCQAAASRLPHNAGLSLRLIGPDGGFVARALDAAVRAAADQLLKTPLAARRK